MSSLLGGSSSVSDKVVFSRRAIIVGAAQGSLLAVLAGRLGWLQMVEGARYQTLSEKNRVDLKMIAPVRGQIFDRFGQVLAGNKADYRALMIAEQADDPSRTLKDLQNLIGISDRDIAGALEDIGKMPSYMAVEVARQLSWDDLARIEVSLLKLPGIQIDVSPMRFYPAGDSLAHVIGYVGAVSPEQYKQSRLFRLPGFKVGKTGVERAMDTQLHGALGFAQMEVNAKGRAVRELGRDEAKAGDDVILSLDTRLQDYAQERLAQEVSASAVIMDANSGAIYSLVSHPSFDPNDFVKGLSQESWNSLLHGRGKPLVNKAVSGQYPPASTFKMVTCLAALEAGIINERTRFTCRGHYEYGSRRFHCWKSAGHGSMDMVQALQQSCDVYFYEIADELGIERLAAMARRLGLGQEFDLQLPGVAGGLVPDKNWKMGHHGQRWRTGDTIVSTIGQGAFLATPLQLAVMTARLVNGGKAIEPYLLESVGGVKRDINLAKSMGINPYHLRLVERGMRSVVNDKKGTAYGSRIEDSLWAMGGKTGTAQVKAITAAQRSAGVKNEDLPWEQRHHALFVGYAPLDNPRYVCSVVVEHGVGGSSTAAPLAKDLMIRAQQLDPAMQTRTGARG